MPTTENDRRNSQQPVLQNPSLPDHDRRKDEGMHAAIPVTAEERVGEANDLADFDNPIIDEVAPDQAFGQILDSGLKATGGRIPEDPNNWNTSDRELEGTGDDDPEDRGESLPDIMDNIQH